MHPSNGSDAEWRQAWARLLAFRQHLPEQYEMPADIKLCTVSADLYFDCGRVALPLAARSDEFVSYTRGGP